MEEQHQPQRKLSRRSSKITSGKSLWHRKSTKKTTAAATETSGPGPAKYLDLQSSQSLVSMDSLKANDTSDEDQDLPLFISRSIIPDPLGELPAWFKKETDMAAANTSSYRIKYPLHNPLGPKWYKNYHLIPPAQLNPGNRPPSVFSPSFPPMASSLNDRSEDSIRLPGPSRSPSGTSLQTPSSSQIRIQESGGKPRSRKTSQDNADLLDASDPWGTHWHHQSPYDTGTNVSPVSVDPPEGRSRSRLSSMNTAPTPTRRKTVTPSPLSQSTSALHTQPSEPNITRKLSKRRKPGLTNLFGGQEKEADPAAPHRASTIATSSLQVPDTSARRHSILSPTTVPPNASTVALSTHSSSKKERRTSVLGRLVRKFSILTKSTQDAGPTISERAEDEPHGAASPSDRRRSFFSQRHPSPEKPSLEKKHSDPSKRVPPPRIDLDLMTDGLGPSTELEREIPDHRSSVSYEMPFSPGRLTIANPDAPSSGGNTPIRQSIALPPEDLPEPKSHVEAPPLLPPVQPRYERNASREAIPSGKTSPVKRISPTPAPSVPDVVRSPPQVASVQSPQPSASYLSPSAHSLSIGAPSLTAPAAIPEVRMFHAFSFATTAAGSTSNDSPLSRASVLVNPPTPYDPNEVHTDLPYEMPPIERVSSRAPSRENSPVKKADGEVRVAKSNSTTSRKTETFRLMRNPSDKVSSSGDAIPAEGEHWTVVNSSDAPRRRRTKERAEKNERVERVEKPSSRSSTKDRESRRDQRRHEKAAQEAAENHARASSQGRTKRTKAEAVDSSSLSGRPSRARSLDTSPRQSVQPMVFTLQGEPPRHRKSDDRPRDSHHSKSSRPNPSPISGIARVERLPSNATRPTSELASAADINALRAREAWEMDRLWKGRSMYHQESNAITSPSARDSRHVNGEFVVDGPGHGSSHTSYLVQPLQAHPMPASVFYANMPSAPPPIIYTATSPYGQVLHQGSHQPTYRSLPNSFMFPSTESSPASPADPPRQNPLPHPPRESTYQPARLSTHADRGSGATSDYWTNNKYPPVPSH
ncbi:uncharacterized protein EDB91DRAFT_1109709 [Suillus paluster]|uniref:uncharacterized protein n=1 Tax=Suillus paluster TaxID=48578 RepID=UPI001B88347D|nr:uncharacterized protein EDB91DRAFT_1109709 [Suillus paluster]KAG1749793.1 hypothetical protein EDB91DRAFT_1109709 [Suillus paluster]